MFINTFKVFFIFSLVVIFSSSIFAQKAKKTETVLIKTAIYCDHCLQCETCGMKFTQELMYTKGVKSMDLNEKTMFITVVYNPKQTTPEKIKLAITKFGYDADELKADPVGVAKLDDCCKK